MSLLPLLFKVFEKVVPDQTKDFLILDEILYNAQSRFSKNLLADAFLSLLNGKALMMVYRLV